MNIIAFPSHLMVMLYGVYAVEIERTYKRSDNDTSSPIGAYQRTVQKRSKIECAAKCSEDDKCVAFYFDKTTKTCSISNGFPNPTAGSLYHEKGCMGNAGYTYVKHLNLCFRLAGDNGDNRRQIKEICESEGAHLILITKRQVNEFLVDEIQKRGLPDSTGRFYIDGNDEANEGEWRSHSGELMSYHDFRIGEPNGGASQNCLYISGVHLQWVDSTCHSETKYGGYICQIDVL